MSPETTTPPAPAPATRAFDLIETLAGEIGPRRPTSTAEAVAAEVIADSLRSGGIDARIEPFRSYASFAYPYGAIAALALVPAAAAEPVAGAAGRDRRRRRRAAGRRGRASPHTASPTRSRRAEPQRGRLDRTARRAGSDAVPRRARRHLAQRPALPPGAGSPPAAACSRAPSLAAHRPRRRAADRGPPRRGRRAARGRCAPCSPRASRCSPSESCAAWTSPAPTTTPPARRPSSSSPSRSPPRRSSRLASRC